MSEYIKYRELESGIHYVIFLHNSREAIDTYIRLFRQIILDLIPPAANTTSTVRILLDFNQTTLPNLTDMVAETIDSRRKLSIASDTILLRIAYLSDDEKLEEMMNHIGTLVPFKSYRAGFKAEEEPLAHEWLLSDD